MPTWAELRPLVGLNSRAARLSHDLHPAVECAQRVICALTRIEIGPIAVSAVWLAGGGRYG